MQGQQTIVLAVNCASAFLIARIGGAGKAREITADVVQCFGQRGPVAWAKPIDRSANGRLVAGKVGYAMVKCRARATIEPGHPDTHVTDGVQQLVGGQLGCLHTVYCRRLAGGAWPKRVAPIVRAKIPVEVVAAVIGGIPLKVRIVRLRRIKTVLGIRAIIVEVTPFAPAAPGHAWCVPGEPGVPIPPTVFGIEDTEGSGVQRRTGWTAVSCG